MIRDPHDQLIDQLLREILGGDRPRDMTARVLAQARILDRFRRRNWLLGGLAAAAALALAVGLTMYWPHEYPGPTADQELVADGGVVDRGTRLENNEQDVRDVDLGGYVNIKMAPQSALTIGGAKYEEKVLLDQGQLDVNVARNRGRFDIAVGPATVHVTGTRFGVNVADETTALARVKKLLVSVKEGSVEVQNIPGMTGTQTVTAGQEKTFTITLAQLRAAARANAGLLAAAQDGARLGNRGGLGTLLAPLRSAQPLASQPATPRVLTPPARGGAAPRGSLGRPVQLMTTPGNMSRLGNVLRTGGVFYLENRDGNFFMFEQAAIAPTHPRWLTLSPDQSCRVVWTDGVVTDIVPAPPPAPAATTTTQPK